MPRLRTFRRKSRADEFDEFQADAALPFEDDDAPFVPFVSVEGERSYSLDEDDASRAPYEEARRRGRPQFTRPDFRPASPIEVRPGMLGLAAAYFAIPAVRGIEKFDQRLGKLGFWLLFLGMLGMSLVFALGGTVQVYEMRILGLDWFGADLRRAMLPYQILVPVFGFVFAIGAIVVVYDLLTLGARATRPAGHEVAASAGALAGAASARPATGWGRTLGGFEAGTWLLAMWIFGAIITLGLLSFNLPTVRAGDSYLPHILAGIGYPGLLAVTLLSVWRFLASREARTAAGHRGPAAAAAIAAAHPGGQPRAAAV